MIGDQSSPQVAGPELARFVRFLREGRTTRVGGRRLWQALAKVYPHRASGPAERQLLAEMLSAAAAASLLRLPSSRGRRWDRSMAPPVPTSVDLITEGRQPATFDWRTFPWHVSLAWVPSLPRLTQRQLGFLRRVHDGLVNGEFEEPVPLKYRSLQLTGDEKGLAGLLSSAVFGPGRLTVETLNCTAETLPLAWEPVRDGGRAIVFENAGPFAVARAVLAELRDPPYDLVVYGGGRAVLASLGHLLTIGRALQSLHYVGDLDRIGLRIAVAVADSAGGLGLPQVRPAEELYRAMLRAASDLGHAGGWPERKGLAARRASGVARDGERRDGDGGGPATDTTEGFAAWLPPDIRQQVCAMLHGRMRIPEEVLGPAEMRRAWGFKPQADHGSCMRF